MSTHKLSKEEYRAKQKEQLVQLHSHIADAVGQIQTGKQWQDFLQTFAKFHRYSWRNSLLIMLQSEGRATLPASYTTWKQVDRFVKKGEKGMKILAPNISKIPLDKDSRQPLKPDEAKERPADEIEWIKGISGFRLVTVFDVSQTDGKELPTLPSPKLLEGGEPQGLRGSLEQIVAEHGFTLDYVAPDNPALMGANGITHFGDNTIHVRNDVSAAQQVKTLIHEIAHMKLHADPEYRQSANFHRGRGEVEAESVAFIVAHAHGMDTSSYTFPYVAVWGKGDTELVASTADRCVGAAQDILEVTMPLRPGSIEAIKELRTVAEETAQRSAGHSIETRQAWSAPPGPAPGAEQFRQAARDIAARPKLGFAGPPQPGTDKVPALPATPPRGGRKAKTVTR